MSRALFLASTLVSLGFVHAQTGLSGPVAGFTFDPPTGSIRAVIGALGSASLGPALVDKLDFSFIAPQRDYAIATRRGQVLFVSGLSSQLSVSGLAGAFSIPEGVVWSGDGSAAVLFSRTGNWIQAFTGFPYAITPGTEMSISALGGSLLSVAVDGDGQRIAVGISGTSGGVFEMADGQSFAPRLGTSDPIALAYSQDNSAFYCLDGSTNQISEITLSSSAVQTWPAGADDAIAIEPAVDSANRKVLYVAGRSSRVLLAYDLSTNQISANVTLSFSPSMIEPLGLNGYLLTRRSGAGLLWSFTSGIEPAVYFVPAGAVPEPQRGVRQK